MVISPPQGDTASIGSDSVTNTELDNADNFTLTGDWTWQESVPTSGQNTWTVFEDTTNTDTWTWALDSNGNHVLLSSNGTVSTVFQIASPATAVTFLETVDADAGIESETRIDHGVNNEIRTEYNSTRDGYVVRDQTNGLDRAEFDRTTGDLTIEGTLTEGATL